MAYVIPPIHFGNAYSVFLVVKLAARNKLVWAYDVATFSSS